MQLEDNYTDVLGKARQGLGLEIRELAGKSGLSIRELNRLLDGEFNESHLRALAPVLGLKASALCALGEESITVDPGLIPATLSMLTSNYGGIMDVNAYLIADPTSRKALLFDTGTDPDLISDEIETRSYTLEGIYLTHTHRDHIACLPRLRNRYRCPVYGHTLAAKVIQGVIALEWEQSFSCGSLSVETRRTTGHASDGTTYVIRGLERDVAMVGDAVFAASMGGGKISYPEALETNRKNIYSLPEDTLICPGHGPMTSVGFEKLWNPFYIAT
jgi:hydroxyacylglutathione hydrolase